MLLHGKGTEVNKNDPKLLAALEEFYRIIAQYDPKNVYNMDKTSLFFQLLLIYIDALWTPWRIQMWVQVKDNGRRRSRDALPSSQHFEG